MTILTSKMKTERISNEFPSVKVFFPFNEGSGNAVSCVITGATVSDSGTATHATPNAVEILTGISAEANGLSSAKLGKRGIALAVYEQAEIVPALCVQVLGGDTYAINLSAISVDLTAGGSSQTLATGGNPAQGSIVAIGVVWDETYAYLYYGDDTDLALISTTALTAGSIAALASGFNLDDAVTFSQTTRGAAYGFMVSSFETSAIPSAADRLTGLNWMKDRWLAGHKEIYPEWKDLT